MICASMKKPETKIKHSEAIKASKSKYDTHAAAKKGWTDERRKIASEWSKSMCADKEKLMARAKKGRDSNEISGSFLKTTERNLRQWADPEYKDKVSKKIAEVKNSPEYKEKHKDQMAYLWVPIEVFNDKHELIKTYRHKGEAAKDLGLSINTIKKAVKSKKLVKKLYYFVKVL